MSKNIVIFSDGTGQEGGVGNNTNVYYLFNMVEDRTPRQVSFYDPGLGTDRSKLGQISGRGITRNIHECYQFLSDTFAAGDRIFLFGFSRGATTVRTLSSFIHLFGVLPRSRPALIRRAWRIYRIGDQAKRDRKAKEFVRANHTMWTKIRFLGVWDTVAALGLPIKTLDVIVDKVPFWHHSFHDLRLADSVEYGRHAVAIDDERLTFHPQLWSERREGPVVETTDAQVEPILMQDIGDIYDLAEKLQNPEHPVSRRLSLDKNTKELLEQFDRDGKRNEPEAKIDALKRAVVADFNLAVYDTSKSLYDATLARELQGLALSPETRQRVAAFDPDDRAALQMLDRLLIEEAYLLRSRTRPPVKQVWFAGMHTDVGGGYAEPELAHIPLLWMVQEAIDVGLRVYPGHHVNLMPKVDGTMHDSRAGLGRLYRRRQRRWDRETNQGRGPLVHESVVARSRLEGSFYQPWILKTQHDVEPWPPRLTQSIQFDEHYIWRESIWGWNSDFLVPWRAIERIGSDRERIVLYLKREYWKYARSERRRDDHFTYLGESRPPTIPIQGCLASSPADLAARLTRHLERRRQKKLADRLAELESRLRAEEGETSVDAQGRPLREEIAEIKADVSRHAPEADPDRLEH